MEGWLDLDPRGGWNLEEGYEALSRLSGHWTLGYLRYDRVSFPQLLALESPRVREAIHAGLSHLQTRKALKSTRTWKATADPHP